MTLSYKDVADIIKIIDASRCDEVIVELADVKIVVRRGGGAGAVAPVTVPAAPVERARPTPVAAPKASTSAVAAPSPEGQIIVRAPMTGTFYRAASPKDPPFVDVGSVVAVGDTLCSIEVMKLFTTITAEAAGKISRIFPNNAELVQYDQPLFAIELTT